MGFYAKDERKREQHASYSVRTMNCRLVQAYLVDCRVECAILARTLMIGPVNEQGSCRMVAASALWQGLSDRQYTFRAVAYRIGSRVLTSLYSATGVEAFTAPVCC